MVKQHMRLSTN